MGTLPPLTRWLGYAGLLPQAAAVAVLLSGDLDWRFVALSSAFAYAALILSFLGGLWWGLAAAGADRAPVWMWVASVVPSLFALITAVPWMIGAAWPGPSLVALGVALLAALLVDRRIVALGLAPQGWMALRVPLSLGLSALSIVAAAL